jgi:hypothetical protein
MQITPETITLNLTKSQERHLLVFQALMILNELVSDRVTIKETHFVYNKPKLVKSIGNKYVVSLIALLDILNLLTLILT